MSRLIKHSTFALWIAGALGTLALAFFGAALGYSQNRKHYDLATSPWLITAVVFCVLSAACFVLAWRASRPKAPTPIVLKVADHFEFIREHPGKSHLEFAAREAPGKQIRAVVNVWVKVDNESDRDAPAVRLRLASVTPSHLASFYLPTDLAWARRQDTVDIPIGGHDYAVVETRIQMTDGEELVLTQLPHLMSPEVPAQVTLEAWCEGKVAGRSQFWVMTTRTGPDGPPPAPPLPSVQGGPSGD